MTYDYDLIFSRRKSISVSISPYNKITVRCPKYFDRKRVDAFLNKKSGWIDKVLENNAKKSAKFSGVCDFKEVLVYGEVYRLQITDKNKIDDGCVFIKDKTGIKRLFEKCFAEELNARLEKISFSTGLKANSVKLRDYKSRWGCCNLKNDIVFNYKMLMLPLSLQNYIIVHELCHTVQHNHSRDFWNLVQKFLPEYKELKKALKEYDFITTLY